MSTKILQRIFSVVALASMLISLVAPGMAQARTSTRSPAALAAPQDPLAKIEAQVLNELTSKGQTDYFVTLKEQADLSAAAQVKTKLQKGEYVYNTLVAIADRTQKDLRASLDAQGVSYTPYYIANTILVHGGSRDLLMAVASRPEVASVTANHAYQAEQPKLQKPLESPAPQAPAGVEPNISALRADQVWALGVTGQNVVLADNNNGLDWDHPAIKNHYRGWNGVTADHNYNWWDATGDFPREPGTVDDLGTESAGVMVGDDGAGNQIGMAPGARVIQCRNGQNEVASLDSWVIECLEWDLAPWDLNGQNPRPDLAPDTVNVFRQLWADGGNTIFRTAIDNLIAAGILVLSGIGDFGWMGGCNNAESPADYPEVLTSGSAVVTWGIPGWIAWLSSHGPSNIDGGYAPDIMAPGDTIRSSIATGLYGYTGNSNIASAHTAGLVALMWSANPALRGQVEATIQIILDTAVPMTGDTGNNCGGDYTTGPNNDWGYGTIDALAAVQAAIAIGGSGALQGALTDSASSDPIQGATIQATRSLTQSFQTSTDANGAYTLGVAAGTYTIDATAFGYLPAQVAGLEVDEGQTVTQDFQLDPAPTYVISITVVDANTGWPLYAQTTLRGAPLAPVWSDPLTGHFELSAPGGSAYTLDVTAWTPGYLPQGVNIGPLSGDIELIVQMEPDIIACNAPGYQFTSTLILAEDFEASDGGYIVAGDNASWEWGEPTYGPGAAHSGSNVWATNLISGTYNDYENSTLASPVIDLSSQAGKFIVLDWWQWLQTEGGYDNADLQVSNDGGATWSTIYGPASGDVDLDWNNHSVQLDPSYAVSNFQVRFHLTSDPAVDFPGWYVDDVGISAGECLPMEGGLVAGNIYDANQHMPLKCATVANDIGLTTLTAATVDGAIDDSFYVLFSPPGSHDFTASQENCAPVTETVEVITGSVVAQDFYLPTGHITFDPLSLYADLEMGTSSSQTFTIANDGGFAAGFTLVEQDKGFAPPLKGAQGAGFVDGAPPAGPDVLIVCVDDNPCEPIASMLAAFGDLGSVTSYDARYRTPTLDELQPYDVVLTWCVLDTWYRYEDIYKMGDVLADYIDAGGKVINAMFSLDPDKGLRGRFFDENYTAMKGGWDVWNEACLGSYDAWHPFMEGITEVCDYYRLGGTSLTPGSTAVAYWSDGEILAAAKDNRTVVSLGTYVGFWHTEEHPADALVHNAILWLAGAEQTPWLGEQPITGTLEAGAGQQEITVTFDAGVPAVTLPGDYHAWLKVKSGTPYLPSSLPVTMTVTAPDSYGVLEGVVQSLGYCDLDPAPPNWAKIVVESVSGLTWTLRTDAAGYYEGWFDSATGPYTLTVSAWQHVGSQVSGVVIEPHGAVTQQDFSLRLLRPCLSVNPTSLDVDAALGAQKTVTLDFTNQGAADADLWSWEEAPWLSEPISGSVTGDSISKWDITFTTFPTMTVGEVYTTTLEIWNNDPVISLWAFYIPVTMTVVTPTYGVAVSADQTGSGKPGEVVTYTVSVTNLSNGPTDSFTVTMGAHVYATGLGEGEDPTIVVGPLAVGASATFVVTMHIPGEAAYGDQDTVVITITSASDPTRTATVSVTTNVHLPRVFLPAVWKTP